MTDAIQLRRDDEGVDWNALCVLYKEAGFGDRDPVLLEEAFRKSDFKTIAWDGTSIVACARALSDGHSYAAIYDVLVRPDLQALGIGRRIMGDLLEQLKDFPYVTLFASPGKTGFYERLGVRNLKTATILPTSERIRAMYCE